MEIEETFSPLALATVGDWLRQRTGLAAPTTAIAGGDPEALPQTPALATNYPNPFNGDTVIRFTLPAPGDVELAILDLAGQRVAVLAQGVRQPGSHTIRWDGRGDGGRLLASGAYLCRLRVGARVEARKLLLLR